MTCENFKRTIVAATVVALAGCGIDRGTPQHRRPAASLPQTVDAAPETFALGLQLTPSGAIAEDSTADAFSRGSVVFLSVDVSSASTDQHIVVEWNDSRGRVLHRESRTVPPRTRHAAFSSGGTSSWRPGPYRAAVAINGRNVSDLRFALM